MIDVNFYPLGYQQLTVAGTAGGLTVPTGATMCMILAEAAVRYRDDGNAPNGSVGVTIPANNWPPLEYSGDLAALQFIAVSGSATLDVSFYGARG